MRTLFQNFGTQTPEQNKIICNFPTEQSDSGDGSLTSYVIVLIFRLLRGLYEQVAALNKIF
jgi:hypothetical protein